MSKKKDQLRKIGICNDYDYAGEKGVVFVTYRTGERDRYPRWEVCRVGYMTDPHAHWRDCGNYTITVYGRGDKIAKLEKAKEYAYERYGIREWAKSPFGSWFDAEFVRLRDAEIKQKLKEAKSNG